MAIINAARQWWSHDRQWLGMELNLVHSAVIWPTYLSRLGRRITSCYILSSCVNIAITSLPAASVSYSGHSTADIIWGQGWIIWGLGQTNIEALKIFCVEYKIYKTSKSDSGWYQSPSWEFYLNSTHNMPDLFLKIPSYSTQNVQLLLVHPNHTMVYITARKRLARIPLNV